MELKSFALPAHLRVLLAALCLPLIAGCDSDPSVAKATDCASLAATAADKAHCAAAVGDLLEVSVGEVLPTQPSLGYHEVFYKLGRYTFNRPAADPVNKKFSDWCESNGQEKAATAGAGASLLDRSSFTCTVAVGAETDATKALMKTGVIGPKGKVYLTDGHHTLTSFLELEGTEVRIRLRILGNLSDLDEAAFWATMQANKWTWLRDADDQPITPAQLPTQLGLANFANDQYRAVLYFARDIGYAQNALPFQEFYWGRWLRTHPTIKLADYNLTLLADYLALVQAIANDQVALAGTAVVSDGFSAADLSKLAAFGSSEFTKLSADSAATKPGKLAYMLQYRQTLNLP